MVGIWLRVLMGGMVGVECCSEVMRRWRWGVAGPDGGVVCFMELKLVNLLLETTLLIRRRFNEMDY
jgi:hypothetical protein